MGEGGSLAGMTGMASSLGSGIIDAAEGAYPTKWGGAGKGVLQGAAMGAALGPIGAGVGALVGGVAGFIGGGAKEKAAAAERAALLQQKTEAAYANKLTSSRQSLQNYPTQGLTHSPMLMARGGSAPVMYKAEGGEVIDHASTDVPRTNARGTTSRLSATSSLIVGDKHSAPSGGIGMSNQAPARIYSDQLKPSEAIRKRLNSF